MQRPACVLVYLTTPFNCTFCIGSNDKVIMNEFQMSERKRIWSIRMLRFGLKGNKLRLYCTHMQVYSTVNNRIMFSLFVPCNFFLLSVITDILILFSFKICVMLWTVRRNHGKPLKRFSGYVRPERVNKWPSSMTDIWWWWWLTYSMEQSPAWKVNQ